MPATIQDVARAARVSPATVSRVLNGRQDVDAAMAARVRTAVTALNYRPNGLARGLRRRATMVVGVIISDVTNPFFTSMVRGVEDGAQDAGYSVVLANSDEDLAKEGRYMEVAAAEQFAGVVLSAASASQTDASVLLEYNIPIVTVDRRLRAANLDSVTVNNRAAARDATQHLLDQGCQRIAFVAGRRETTTARDRLAGYRDALAATGHQPDRKLIAYGDFRIEGGYAAARELLNLDPRPDGIFISNNLMTIGALDALAEAGLSYPDDIAVVSFDDIPSPPEARTRISTVSQPTYEIGRRAVDILLRRIRGEQLGRQRIVLPATLTIGKSSTRRRKEEGEISPPPAQPAAGTPSSVA